MLKENFRSDQESDNKDNNKNIYVKMGISRYQQEKKMLAFEIPFELLKRSESKQYYKQ